MIKYVIAQSRKPLPLKTGLLLYTCLSYHVIYFETSSYLFFLCFYAGGAAPAPAPHANPFQVTQPAPPTLNQMRVSPMPSGFGTMAEPMSLASVPAQPITMVPLTGMAPMGRVVPGMGVGPVGGGTSVGMSAGIPASMSMPQPLMSMPPQTGAQPTGTTNPFLL